jgi:UDP-glucose 6-dehydrogenase
MMVLLPAWSFSDIGHDVTYMEIGEAKVARVKKGESSIYPTLKGQ